MLNLLRKQKKVVQPTDSIVNDISNHLKAKYDIDLEDEVIANIISSQSYLAFNLGVKMENDVRFPRLGAFKVNHYIKNKKNLYRLVLDECNGDEQLANDTMKYLREQNVFQNI